MKKRTLALVMALALCVTGVFAGNVSVQAEEIGEEIDYSYLMTEDALIGHMEDQTWGVYLADGYSIINDAGNGKIGAGGTTTAARKCKVSVETIVEYLSNGRWLRVTSWKATKESGYSVGTGKTISVAGGYWYRVRCTHTAATDTGSSNTGALWME